MAKKVTTKVARTFNLKDAGAAVKSPLKLRDWLDKNIPLFVGPRITSFDPLQTQRDAIITIRGSRFAASRADNQVAIGGANAPVLAASATELKVLVPRDAESGAVEVTTGGRMATAPHDFTLKGYPAAGSGEDGPPVYAEGAGEGAEGDANPIGTLKVLVVICQAKDLVPAAPATVRTTVDNRWRDVQTFYSQASYTRTDIQYDIVPGAAALDGNFTDFVTLADPVNNIISGQKNRIAAIAAKHAQDNGFDLNQYTMLCSVVFTDGGGVRAWGNVSTQTFTYVDALPASDPNHVDISISLNQTINLLWINEDSNWGRFAHEFGHNIVSAPTSSGDGTATLGEDVYGSDLVDANAATAKFFEMMGKHDTHPIYTGYHLQKLGYYTKAFNIRDIPWDLNPRSEEVDIVAHGLNENTNASRVHILKISISNALSYFVEVRQRPPAGSGQIFDDQIPVGAAPNAGGVIVTRVISDEMHNNQQTRFITLMHEERVQIAGDTIEDPARTIRFTVVNDSVSTNPLVCRVRYEWAQNVADDPSGTFDLNIEPWDGSYQTPDIWVDRDPFGAFDNPNDAQGRPTGTGDRPRVNEVNHFTSRVHVSGANGASNVKVTFYAVSPPGVGDNGNWAPIDVKTIANIPVNGFQDVSCNWVPVIDKHTCLKVYASQQLGEISGGNNGAQENVFEFQAPGASPVDPIFIKTAIRNPLDEPTVVHLSTRGLPAGYAAQIPHSWVHLGARGEKEIDVMIWPRGDTASYKIGTDKNRNKEKRFVGTAPFRVSGHIPRDYGEEDIEKHPGSRFFPIGGTFYRVNVRKRATIRLELDERVKTKDSIGVMGSVQPVSTAQRILIDGLLPDGKTRRTAEVLTNSTGAFNARIAIADDHKKLQTGTYTVQAVIFHASELADAESNILFVKR